MKLHHFFLSVLITVTTLSCRCALVSLDCGTNVLLVQLNQKGVNALNNELNAEDIRVSTTSKVDIDFTIEADSILRIDPIPFVKHIIIVKDSVVGEIDVTFQDEIKECCETTGIDKIYLNDKIFCQQYDCHVIIPIEI